MTGSAAPLEGHAPSAAGLLHTNSRKVFILPTRFGVLFGGALLLMLLVSVNYNNGLGHLFTFLLAGIAVVAMHYTQRNLVGIRLDAAPGRPVFAGDTARAVVTASDELRREHRAVWLRTDVQERIFDLERHGRARIELPFATPRRGLVPLPAVALVTIYPMGLFCAWTRPVRSESRLLVYPRPAAPGPRPDTGGGEDTGDAAGRRPGQGDFDALRDHQRGDPLSRVHWRASARGAGLKTKVFDGEGRSEHVLRWRDASGDTEARLSTLCRWVLDADAAGLAYALELPGSVSGLGTGNRHRDLCLERLALFEPGS